LPDEAGRTAEDRLELGTKAATRSLVEDARREQAERGTRALDASHDDAARRLPFTGYEGQNGEAAEAGLERRQQPRQRDGGMDEDDLGTGRGVHGGRPDPQLETVGLEVPGRGAGGGGGGAATGF